MLGFVFLLPTGVIAQVQANDPGTGITYECNRSAPGECRFEDLISAVQKVLNWGRNFALMFSVIVIAYAGFDFMVSGDKSSKREDAKKRLGKVALGIIFILAAWLIVTLILTALGTSSVVQLG